MLEFLDLPEQFSEKNLRKAIIENLKQFILEFGRDFTFIGEEYRVQVGNTDFFIDLLFYNRALSCLVPIELKIGKFKPEHIGQINFYLEALDRDVKKPNENPSVGVILCASKDDAVVEYIQTAELQKPKLTREQMAAWFEQFRHGDSANREFQKRLIDTFVNAVYVFNDKLVLTYNYQHGTQTISLDEIESALSSDFDGATPTKARKSEEKP